MWACVCVYVCACVRVCDLPISARILPVPSLPSPISRHPPSCSTSLPPLQRPQDRPSIRQVLRHPFITRRNQILHDLQQGTSPGQGTASSSHALHPAHEHVGNGNSGAGARRHGEHAGAPASLTHGHRNAVLQHQHAGNSASATTTTSRASNSRSPPHRHHAHVPAKTTATTTTTTTTTTTAAAATAAATTTAAAAAAAANGIREARAHGMGDSARRDDSHDDESSKDNAEDDADDNGWAGTTAEWVSGSKPTLLSHRLPSREDRSSTTGAAGWMAAPAQGRAANHSLGRRGRAEDEGDGEEARGGNTHSAGGADRLAKGMRLAQSRRGRAVLIYDHPRIIADGRQDPTSVSSSSVSIPALGGLANIPGVSFTHERAQRSGVAHSAGRAQHRQAAARENTHDQPAATATTATTAATTLSTMEDTRHHSQEGAHGSQQREPQPLSASGRSAVSASLRLRYPHTSLLLSARAPSDRPAANGSSSSSGGSTRHHKVSGSSGSSGSERSATAAQQPTEEEHMASARESRDVWGRAPTLRAPAQTEESQGAAVADAAEDAPSSFSSPSSPPSSFGLPRINTKRLLPMVHTWDNAEVCALLGFWAALLIWKGGRGCAAWLCACVQVHCAVFVVLR